MTEKGSDELLAEAVADRETIGAPAQVEAALRAEEEQRVASTEPAEHELGGQYPDPDEIPAGDPPDYDPTPPEVPA